ncbi:MAG: uracil-DNA glycosylase [Alphaproteobacteria bacterium]|nr:MAG: uracil-DNA glycosylase [Alphaproteobacteria bacterium]
MEDGALARLMRDIRACRLCVEQPAGRPLPHAPRPVAVLSATARIAICGQAPGTRVHASGVPFTDPSGDRLREWMGVDAATFYDAARIAIVPMGFCFPGLDAKGGDLPPRRECARHWRVRVFAAMPQIELLLAVGRHAQKWHLGPLCGSNLTATVTDWRAVLAATGRPAILPLPHPSWRNNAWVQRHPWFKNELLPVLKERICRLL